MKPPPFASDEIFPQKPVENPERALIVVRCVVFLGKKGLTQSRIPSHNIKNRRETHKDII